MQIRTPFLVQHFWPFVLMRCRHPTTTLYSCTICLWSSNVPGKFRLGTWFAFTSHSKWSLCIIWQLSHDVSLKRKLLQHFMLISTCMKHFNLHNILITQCHRGSLSLSLFLTFAVPLSLVSLLLPLCILHSPCFFFYLEVSLTLSLFVSLSAIMKYGFNQQLIGKVHFIRINIIESPISRQRSSAWSDR